jgi:hypothetical protein
VWDIVHGSSRLPHLVLPDSAHRFLSFCHLPANCRHGTQPPAKWQPIANHTTCSQGAHFAAITVVVVVWYIPGSSHESLTVSISTLHEIYGPIKYPSCQFNHQMFDQAKQWLSVFTHITAPNAAAMSLKSIMISRKIEHTRGNLVYYSMHTATPGHPSSCMA